MRNYFVQSFSSPCCLEEFCAAQEISSLLPILFLILHTQDGHVPHKIKLQTSLSSPHHILLADSTSEPTSTLEMILAGYCPKDKKICSNFYPMDRRVQRVTHGSRCGQSINYQTSRSTWAFNHKNKVYRREINPSSHLLSVRRWIRRRNTFG